MRVTIDGTPCSPSQSSHSLVEDLPLTTERSCSVQYYVGWSSLKKMYVHVMEYGPPMSCRKGLAHWVWVCQVCQLVNIPIWSPSSQHTTLMLLDVIGICFCMLSSTYNNKMPCFFGGKLLSRISLTTAKMMSGLRRDAHSTARWARGMHRLIFVANGIHGTPQNGEIYDDIWYMIISR